MTKLYTAAEARRIDIERGGTGRIIKPSDYDQNWHLFFHEETRTWRICENQGGQLQHEIYDSPFCLVKEIWSALTPEQKPIVLDYLVLVDANERIKQLEKELAEATQNYHEILADHGELTRQFDELTEKARKRECAHELPEREKRIYYFDTPGRLMGHGGYYPAIGCFVLNTLFACVELTDAQVKFWTWKYEADL